jgi:hypothetical protein
MKIRNFIINIIKYVLTTLLIFNLISLVGCTSFNVASSTFSETTEQSQPLAMNTIAGSALGEDEISIDTSSSVTKAEDQKLSEQPDIDTFKEYFRELGLGKLPENGQLPFDLKKDDNIFVSNGENQLVIYGELLKDAKLSNAIYDLNAKNNIRDKAESPILIKKGGFVISEPVKIPPGKYEYKIWIGDKLVGVFPFEVKP